MSKPNGVLLIETLSKLLVANPPEGADRFGREQIEQLLHIYYRHISPTDLEEHDPKDLLGALIAHWRLMRRRRPDASVVRVYNPDQEEHGWCSVDTIVEVVARDMPFLVDSISAALNQRGLAIKLTIHPVFGVERDDSGLLIALRDKKSEAGYTGTEAVIQMHVERQPTEGLADLQRRVTEVIRDVTLATSDWLEMKRQAETVRDEVVGYADIDGVVDAAEERAFLDWVIADHFLFVACCQFELEAGQEKPSLRYLENSGLGVLRGGEQAKDMANGWILGLDVDLSSFQSNLLVTKANARSTVHRPAYMDCIAIKRLNDRGELVGLSCLLGLFASGAYNTPPRQIPLLRKKVDQVFATADVSPSDHSGRVVANILDNFPRDTLFQISAEDLQTTTLGVLELQERQRTRLFVTAEPFRRFYTCLVYLPRERYSREVRMAIENILVDAFEGTDVVFDTQFSESILARLHYVVRVPPGVEPPADLKALEARVVEVATTWQDGLRSALFGRVEEVLAARYLRDYAQAFPGGYREDVHPRTAVSDIERIERARRNGRVVPHVYHPIVEQADQVHVRLYSPGAPVSLSRAIPILEHMGLDVFGERPYRVRHHAGDVWIHDFATRRSGVEGEVPLSARRLFVDTFLRIWEGDIDNDGFNGLVLSAELSWKEAMLFRAYSRYQHQIKVPHTQAYTIKVLNSHPEVMRVLNRLFQLRFDPDRVGEDAEEERRIAEFESLLEAISSLDEDRILRNYLNLIQATLRTNFYCSPVGGGDGDAPYLSFKSAPGQINGMPQPLPMFEIFVFSVRMEGVHLRGGRVARGGLRWSDRMEDYRTEVLGLMKAQMVKNTVIVPVGSKGGFVVRNGVASHSREQRMEQGIACYRTLLRGMLDITDNLVGTEVVPPQRVLRHDGDDPYLVIAADKGTATFSDIANQVALDYGFWLGDAFASGGSAGYDHKVMGITAKGAWESVKRNFRELGLDIQSQDFTVVGIGDMSGDVFGNGMLLSRHIRLLGAFNHRHIFLDPTPDAATSYAERERLFRLPRSGWSDYDQRLISPGGGIHSRDAKSIALTPEVKKMLQLEIDRIAPNDLIRELLKAQVDLLWNGGIGTYVKASSETDGQVHDKANDAVRVDATELRCRVVGEGGNLGFTQLARVEFAMQSGQIYTDAIDNSAGVDCSDHEVNIKVLLDKLVADGDLTKKQRNLLLVEMTGDVSDLVLANNYAQTQAVSNVVVGGAQRLYEQARFIDLLEQSGRLSRQLEGLPDKKALTERMAQEKGLTKPEVAVLLAYSKMSYFEAVVGSDIPDDPFVVGRLVKYFPPILGDRYPDEIADHRLRREIIAMLVGGEIADHVGPGIGFRVREEVGSDIAGVARAYLAVSEIFETDTLWTQIQALDNRVAACTQVEMLAAVSEFLEQMLTAVLRGYKDRLDMTALKTRFHDGAAELWDALPRPLADQDKAGFERRLNRWADEGVPHDLARAVAGLEPMSAALDIVEVAQQTAIDIAYTAWVHSALNHSLDLAWIRHQVSSLAVRTHWHLMARTKLQAALDRHHRDLTADVLRSRQSQGSPRGMLEHWTEQHHVMLERHEHIIAEFKAGNVFDFAILSLAVAGVGELLPVANAIEPPDPLV